MSLLQRSESSMTQVLKVSGWRSLWPDTTMHQQARHMLGNLALLPASVNVSLGNKALMRETVAAYVQGPVHFISTSELTPDDWNIDRLIERHKKIMYALALRLALPTTRLEAHLPNKSDDDSLENTGKWA